MPAALKVLRIAWRLAPWLVLAAVGLRWWAAPPVGSSSAPGQTVTVAGEAALTKPARKWKKRPPAICEPGPGDTGGRFRVQTREPAPEELERLARQYGFTFGDRQLSADLAGMPAPPTAVAGGTPQLAVARVLGEYTAPVLRYGGTFASALLVDGELETRFDPAPTPRLAFPMVWGGGAFYDLTQKATAEATTRPRWRLYGLLEPIQTKQVYWRVEAGVQEIAALAIAGDLKRDLFVGVGVEWRNEPWIRKNRRGLRAVKLPN